jgi:hypothetical protein
MDKEQKVVISKVDEGDKSVHFSLGNVDLSMVTECPFFNPKKGKRRP